MPSLINLPAPVSVAAVATTGGTEKVIATSNVINPDTQEFDATVFGEVEILTNATAATAVVVKVRRGTLITSPQVGTSITISTAAATRYCIPFMVTEALSQGAGVQYSVTTTETGGGGNVGTVDQATIAVVLSTAN